MTTEDLDTLIRLADPARGIDIPTGDGLRLVATGPGGVSGAEDVSAETSSERGHPSPLDSKRPGRRWHGSHRRRRWFAGAGVAAAAAVLVAILVAVVPGPTGLRSAAAAVLQQAATAAGEQAPLGPGQYLYTETQTEVHHGLYDYGPAGGSEVGTATSGETDQSWAGGDGDGHQFVTVGTRQYPSAADQAAWAAAPTARLGVPMTAWQPTGATRGTVPLMDLSGLPTNPTALAARIAAQDLPTVPTASTRGGGLTATVLTYQLIDGYPYSVFEGAAILLVVPSTGMTPALASALFQVMAAQPGVRLLGTVSDHDGREGQGLALPTAGSTRVSEVIVDPESGQLLEARFVSPPTVIPAQRTCGGAAAVTTTTCVPYTGYSGSTAPKWTDVVARGVVGSGTATVPATGTIAPTATLVPGAPTGLTATATVGGIHLTWTAPADAGAGPVTDYLVGRTTGDGRGVEDVGSATTTFTYPTDTFSPTEATFTVQAVNADGYGPASASVTITSVPAPPPVFPSP